MNRFPTSGITVGRTGSTRCGRFAAGLLACAWVLSLPGDVLAGGFHTPDFGTRRNGMLAVMGKPDDVTAVFHNVAGLTLLEGTNLYLTAQYTYADLGFRFYDSKGILRPDHEITPVTSWAIVPFLGVSSDLGTKRLRVALAVYAPNLYGADLPADEPSRYHLTKGFFFAAHLTGAVAWKVTDKFSIGAGISAVYLVMQGTQFMNPLVNNNPDLRFDSSAKVRDWDIKVALDGRGWTWDWNVGLLFRPIPTLGIGMSFTSGADVSLEGPVTIRASRATSVPMKGRQTTTFAIPFCLRAGINWEFVKDFELGLDASYWHYQVNQEQQMKVDASIASLVGSGGVVRTPKEFTNSWNVSVGLLYRVIPQVDLMIGFQRDASPIPTRTMTVENLNRGLTSVSMGVRWRAAHWVTVGLTYMRTWADLLVLQDSVLNPPTNGKGHGSMSHVAADLLFHL
jgi:long-chain fatty acid transport protein